MAKNNHSESQRAAVARYDAKTYKKINIALRIEDDAEVIASWQDA